MTISNKRKRRYKNKFDGPGLWEQLDKKFMYPLTMNQVYFKDDNKKQEKEEI